MGARLTAAQAEKLNNSSPDRQEVDLGTAVYNIEQYGMYMLSASITADATGAQSITVPFACEIIDVIVQARATSGSGTVTVRSSTNAITDAIVMAVDTTIVRAGTIDDAYSSLTTASSLNVITNGAADRGLVQIIVKRAD